MKRIFIVILFTVLFLGSAQGVSAASDDGYFIRDFHAEVTANPDRSYDVVETIDVWFEEASYGIERKIPAWSWLEKFEVRGFQAVGDPYVLEGEDCLRTGDNGVPITGGKTYQIKYTLVYFADDDPDADYFFLNLIDAEWGVRIDKFSASITLPEGAVIEEYTLTGGAYGKEDPGLADVKIADNTMNIEGKQGLSKWDGFSLNAKLPEGTFSGAGVFAPALEVALLDISIDIDKYGVMTIEENYSARVNSAVIFDRHISGYEGLRKSSLTTIKLDGSGNPPELVDNFSVAPSEADNVMITGPSGEVVAKKDTLDLSGYVGEDVNFSVSYTLENRLRESAGDVGFYLQLMKGYYTEMRVDRLSLSIAAPFDVLRLYGGGGGSLREILGEPVISGGRLTAESVGAFENQDISYVVEFKGAGFIRRANAIDFAFPAVLLAVMICVLFFALVHRKERPIVPVVGFYPPEGMDPAAVGYVIDERVTGRDVTSLLYFWASQGHLKIEIVDGKKYVLHLLTELDAEHTDYEQRMFASIWAAAGRRKSVTSDELKKSFYAVVKATAGAVKKSFSGERGIYLKGRSPIVAGSFFLMCIGFVAFTIVGQFVDYIAGVFPMRPLFGADKRFGEYENDFYLMFIIVLFALLFTMYFATNFYRSDRALKSVPGLIRRLICLALGVAGTVMFTIVCGDGKILLTLPAAVSVASLFVIVNALPFIARLSDYGVHIRGLCLGFKMFLTAAEKQRLELLLQETPDYYYNILAYAQVLGVSKIWQRKFDRLAINPSSWLFGTETNYTLNNSGYIMTGIANDLGRRTGRQAGTYRK